WWPLSKRRQRYRRSICGRPWEGERHRRRRTWRLRSRRQWSRRQWPGRSGSWRWHSRRVFRATVAARGGPPPGEGLPPPVPEAVEAAEACQEQLAADREVAEMAMAPAVQELVALAVSVAVVPAAHIRVPVEERAAPVDLTQSARTGARVACLAATARVARL